MLLKTKKIKHVRNKYKKHMLINDEIQQNQTCVLTLYSTLLIIVKSDLNLCTMELLKIVVQKHIFIK